MKKTVIFVLSVVFVLTLSACSIGKSEQVKVSEKFLEEMVVERDVEKGNKYLSKSVRGELGASDSGEEATSEEAEKFANNLLEISKKTEYKVEETEDPNKVKVTMDYINISQPVGEAIQSYFGYAFVEAFSGGNASEKESQDKMYKEINMRLLDFNPDPTTVVGHFELKEENGEMLITSIEENLIEAMAFGIGDWMGE